MKTPNTFLDGRVTLHVGDCLATMRGMKPESVDCVVTSPPYWGLRDYGVDGQHGLEPTLGEHISRMVEVFDAVKRILKPTGVVFVNYGDCYATSPNGRSVADSKELGNDDRTFRDKPFSTIGPVDKSKRIKRGSGRWGGGNNSGGPVLAEGQPSTATRGANSANKQAGEPSSKRIRAGGYLKPKDLCMIPNRFAIAMQDAGWWVRSEIIWGKSNPMPESIKDRPATAHEKIFMFTKEARYFYDHEAVRQRRTGEESANVFRGGSYTQGKPGPRRVTGNKRDKLRGSTPRHEGHIQNQTLDDFPRGNGRNLRNYEPAPLEVWRMATRPFSEAHFATFPPELAERCILAGCPLDGVVFDPYGGAGTTALVAARHNRKSILIELNPEYAALAQKRIEAEWKVRQEPSPHNYGPLFAT